MDEIRFEWDERKAAENRRRHRVSFEEAATAFADENALLLDDPEHSETEDRFVPLGLNAALRMLVVVHCYRAEEPVIRIISARKATRSESAQYDERWR
jgi:uncharacterized DUF497 family protein